MSIATPFATNPDYDTATADGVEAALTQLRLGLKRLNNLNTAFGIVVTFEPMPTIAQIERDIPELEWPTVAQIEAAMPRKFGTLLADPPEEPIVALTRFFADEGYDDTGLLAEAIVEKAALLPIACHCGVDGDPSCPDYGKCNTGPKTVTAERVLADPAHFDAPAGLRMALWLQASTPPAAIEASSVSVSDTAEPAAVEANAEFEEARTQADQDYLASLATPPAMVGGLSEDPVRLQALQDAADAAEDELAALAEIDELLATTRPVVDVIDEDCVGTGECPARRHGPDCVGRWRTEEELRSGVVPPEEELIARANLMHAALDLNQPDS